MKAYNRRVQLCDQVQANSNQTGFQNFSPQLGYKRPNPSGYDALSVPPKRPFNGPQEYFPNRFMPHNYPSAESQFMRNKFLPLPNTRHTYNSNFTNQSYNFTNGKQSVPSVSKMKPKQVTPTNPSHFIDAKKTPLELLVDVKSSPGKQLIPDPPVRKIRNTPSSLCVPSAITISKSDTQRQSECNSPPHILISIKSNKLPTTTVVNSSESTEKNGCTKTESSIIDNIEIVETKLSSINPFTTQDSVAVPQTMKLTTGLSVSQLFDDLLEYVKTKRKMSLNVKTSYNRTMGNSKWRNMYPPIIYKDDISFIPTIPKESYGLLEAQILELDLESIASMSPPPLDNFAHVSTGEPMHVAHVLETSNPTILTSDEPPIEADKDEKSHSKKKKCPPQESNNSSKKHDKNISEELCVTPSTKKSKDTESPVPQTVESVSPAKQVYDKQVGISTSKKSKTNDTELSTTATSPHHIKTNKIEPACPTKKADSQNVLLGNGLNSTPASSTLPSDVTVSQTKSTGVDILSKPTGESKKTRSRKKSKNRESFSSSTSTESSSLNSTKTGPEQKSQESESTSKPTNEFSKKSRNKSSDLEILSKASASSSVSVSKKTVSQNKSKESGSSSNLNVEPASELKKTGSHSKSKHIQSMSSPTAEPSPSLSKKNGSQHKPPKETDCLPSPTLDLSAPLSKKTKRKSKDTESAANLSPLSVNTSQEQYDKKHHNKTKDKESTARSSPLLVNGSQQQKDKVEIPTISKKKSSNPTKQSNPLATPPNTPIEAAPSSNQDKDKHTDAPMITKKSSSNVTKGSKAFPTPSSTPKETVPPCTQEQNSHIQSPMITKKSANSTKESRTLPMPPSTPKETAPLCQQNENNHMEIESISKKKGAVNQSKSLDLVASTTKSMTSVAPSESKNGTQAAFPLPVQNGIPRTSTIPHTPNNVVTRCTTLYSALRHQSVTSPLEVDIDCEPAQETVYTTQTVKSQLHSLKKRSQSYNYPAESSDPSYLPSPKSAKVLAACKPVLFPTPSPRINNDVIQNSFACSIVPPVCSSLIPPMLLTSPSNCVTEIYSNNAVQGVQGSSYSVYSNSSNVTSPPFIINPTTGVYNFNLPATSRSSFVPPVSSQSRMKLENCDVKPIASFSNNVVLASPKQQGMSVSVPSISIQPYDGAKLVANGQYDIIGEYADTIVYFQCTMCSYWCVCAHTAICHIVSNKFTHNMVMVLCSQDSVCRWCDKKCASPAEVVHHWRLTHSGNDMIYRCSLPCQSRFTMVAHLCLHLDTHHAGEEMSHISVVLSNKNKYANVVCRLVMSRATISLFSRMYLFAELYPLDTMVKLDSWTSPQKATVELFPRTTRLVYQCSNSRCQFIFLNFDDAKNHSAEDHTLVAFPVGIALTVKDGIKFNCVICHAPANNLNESAYHFGVHMGKMLLKIFYKCKYCNALHGHIWALITHLTMVHRLQLQPFSFVSGSVVFGDMSITNNSPNEICFRVFGTLND